MRSLGIAAATVARRRARSLAGAVLLLLGFAAATSAQEAVRLSMASAQAAEARRRAATMLKDYSLELGPTAWQVGAGLGLEYNDNIDYTEDDPKSDIILRPQTNMRMVWPISDRNSLDLSLGAGYMAYLEHAGFSRFFVTPDSEVAFDVYAGDVWINLHNRLSITEYGYQDPTVAGTGDYSQLENTSGVSALWDLNKGFLRWGYDHEIYTALSGEQSRPDGQSDVFSFSPGVAPKPELQFGAEFGGALLYYSGSSATYSDATQWNVGGFFDAQVSQYIHFSGHGGYTVYTPDSDGVSSSNDDFNGAYGIVALTHKVNQRVSYSLSGSRTIQTTLSSGSVDMYNVQLQANWRVIRKTNLSTSFVYYHGTEFGASSEDFDQYGPQIRLSRRLSDKLTGSLGYRFYRRDSNQSGSSYTLNVVSLDVMYTF